MLNALDDGEGGEKELGSFMNSCCLSGKKGSSGSSTPVGLSVEIFLRSEEEVTIPSPCSSLQIDFFVVFPAEGVVGGVMDGSSMEEEHDSAFISVSMDNLPLFVNIPWLPWGLEKIRMLLLVSWQ